MEFFDQAFAKPGIFPKEFGVLGMGEHFGAVPGLLEIVFPNRGVIHLIAGEKEEGHFGLLGGRDRRFLVSFNHFEKGGFGLVGFDWDLSAAGA